MDLISLIIPVYKVEPYINRCIESLVNQTYTNLEIILVDDGSPDNCPGICDSWACRDNRIRVLHKENGGLSDARNAGLSIATGEFIAFIDSDDWIHTTYVEQLYIALKNNHADISACDIQMLNEREKESDICIPIEVKEFTVEQALKTLISGNVFRAVVWNKLYRRRLLLNEEFEIGRYHEDEFFTYRILAKANKVVYVNAKLYYYFQRSGSIMNSNSSKHLDFFDAYLERLIFLQDKYPKLYFDDKANFCVACISFYNNIGELSKEEQIFCKKQLKKYRCKIRFRFNELTNYSLKQLVYIIGSRINIDVFCKLLYLKRKKR